MNSTSAPAQEKPAAKTGEKPPLPYKREFNAELDDEGPILEFINVEVVTPSHEPYGVSWATGTLKVWRGQAPAEYPWRMEYVREKAVTGPAKENWICGNDFMHHRIQNLRIKERIRFALRDFFK